MSTELSCREALERLYGYLDGELEPETQDKMHRHLEQCRRCYPYFDFERIFLDHVRAHGREPVRNEDLAAKVRSLISAQRNGE